MPGPVCEARPRRAYTLRLCPSFRGLPSQAFEYILYNKGIMGEDSYPYRGLVTVGGISCVSSPFHLYPPPPCCHSYWGAFVVLAHTLCSHQGPLVTPAPVASTLFHERDPPTSTHIALFLCDSTSPPCLHLHPEFGLFIRKHLSALTLGLSDQLNLYTYLTLGGSWDLLPPHTHTHTAKSFHQFPSISINSRFPQTKHPFTPISVW